MPDGAGVLSFTSTLLLQHLVNQVSPAAGMTPVSLQVSKCLSRRCLPFSAEGLTFTSAGSLTFRQSGIVSVGLDRSASLRRNAQVLAPLDFGLLTFLSSRLVHGKSQPEAVRMLRCEFFLA